MLAAVTERTRLIFVCNPNNPTSTVVDPDALTRFVEAVPPDILIAIDEAYVEYIRDGMAARQRGAGPRARQCRGAAHVFEGLRPGGPASGLRDRPSRRDHRAGQGLRTVHRDQHLAGRGHRLAGRRRRATGAHRRGGGRAGRGSAPSCARPGSALPPSQANFVWLPLGPRTHDFVEQAAKPRIVVRPYGTDGVRVTVTAAPEENDAMLRFARSWI